jgi:hypothetical protein
MTFQKKSQLLEVIQEYKSDNSALKVQIDDLKKQIDDAEARIKRLLIRCEQFTNDNTKE